MEDQLCLVVEWWRKEGSRAHLVEVRDLRDVDQVDHSKVLNLLLDRIERLVHLHARRVPIVS